MEFKKKIRKVGKDSCMIIIPKTYIKDGQLVVNKEYHITITEIKNA